MPNIEVVATCGIIAGSASSSTDAVYKAGSLSIQQMLKDVPNLKKIANIFDTQFYNIDSVVITHGTDSLVQTALFLNQVLHTSKSVILV